MRPAKSPSSRSHWHEPVQRAAPALARRSAVSAGVGAPSVSLPRRSGRPVCCSQSSLPVAAEHAAVDSPSGAALPPVRASVPSIACSLPLTAALGPRTATEPAILPVPHSHAAPSLPYLPEIPLPLLPSP